VFCSFLFAGRFAVLDWVWFAGRFARSGFARSGFAGWFAVLVLSSLV
jgi:hypothetical protein